MGESVAEATVIKWTKNPGDHIEADETVMEIATDKVDSDVPSPVAGKLLERFYNDNDVVQVGAVIAIIETSEAEEVTEDTAPLSAPVKEHSSPVIAETPKVTEAIPPASVQIPEPIPTEPVKVPEPVVETSAAENEAIEVSKQPVFNEPRAENIPPVPFTEQLEQKQNIGQGDAPSESFRFYSPLVKNIAAQEGLSAAELDKIPGTGAEGRLTKDDLLLYIQNRYKQQPVTNEPVSPAVQAEKEQPVASKIPVAARAEHVPASAEQVPPVVEVTVPVAEKPVEQAVTDTPVPEPAVESTQPTPTPVAEAPKTAPAPEPAKVVSEPAIKSSGSMSGGDEIIEMDRMRRLIADHMVMSKHTSPHVTSFVEADVTNIVLWREKIKNSFEKREGEKITYTPIFIEAVVRAIKDLPMINISVNGTQIIKKKDINISMATALPNGNLIVPVIKKADELSLLGLTKSVNDLASRARTGKLKPDDVQGGTFTITNVGSFGNVMGTPIINQPQVAILAVGAIRKKPAVIETLQGDMIAIRHMMFLSLSYDHRVVDGSLGGSFVKRVSDYLENWDPGREI